MLHILNIDDTGCEIFEVMHYKLFLVGNKNGYAMLFTEKFKAPLGHFSLFLNLLKTWKIKGIPKSLQSCIKVHTFLLDLVTKDLDFLLETFNTIFFLHDFMIPLLLQSTSHLIYSRPNPHVKVWNLIEKECLEKFHFSFNVSQISLVNLRKYSWAGIINGCNALYFDVKDLISHV